MIKPMALCLFILSFGCANARLAAYEPTLGSQSEVFFTNMTMFAGWGPVGKVAIRLAAKNASKAGPAKIDLSRALLRFADQEISAACKQVGMAGGETIELPSEAFCEFECQVPVSGLLKETLMKKKDLSVTLFIPVQKGDEKGSGGMESKLRLRSEDYPG